MPQQKSSEHASIALSFPSSLRAILPPAPHPQHASVRSRSLSAHVSPDADSRSRVRPAGLPVASVASVRATAALSLSSDESRAASTARVCSAAWAVRNRATADTARPPEPARLPSSSDDRAASKPGVCPSAGEVGLCGAAMAPPRANIGLDERATASPESAPLSSGAVPTPGCAARPPGSVPPSEVRKETFHSARALLTGAAPLMRAASQVQPMRLAHAAARARSLQ
mmetsp:Transcript_2717/g.10935  ORF Transcript_2717/g.10935 Transcript_2717/m.10935 type:complete len:227 (+) Transcript_2717:2654-3334(+)